MNRIIPLIVVILAVVFSGCASPIDNSTYNNGGDITTQSPSEETTTPTKAPDQKVTEIKGNDTSKVSESTSTELAGTTQPPTPTNPSNWSREKRYSYFIDNYTDIVVDTEIVESSIAPNNKSMGILYRVDEKNDTRRGNQTREIIIAYAVLVDLYLDDNTSFDKKWIPKHVNATAVNSSGDIYYTGYVKFEWVYKWQVASKWKNSEYIFTFYETLDHGPAHPDYEEDPYDK